MMDIILIVVGIILLIAGIYTASEDKKEGTTTRKANAGEIFGGVLIAIFGFICFGIGALTITKVLN